MHKAIRRLAPAPKARVPKGHIITDPPNLSTALGPEDLVDISTTAPFLPLKRSETENSSFSQRKNSALSHNSPPQTTFYLRNSNSAGGEDAIAQRGPTPDIRERLKHLGPSNLASRPRQTRYHAVKIKPGGSPAVSNTLSQTDTERPGSESHVPFETTARRDSGPRSALIGSAGMEAKDAVHALKSGYGTMSEAESGAKKSRDTVSNQTQHLPDMPLPEAEDDTDIHQPISSQSQSEGIQSDTSKNNNYYHPRGPTRSGSITEQVVDINGIRKVVLQTTSSNSSQSGDGKSGLDDKSPKSPNGGSLVSNNNEAGGANDPGGQNVKKRRRRKKRSGAKQSGPGGAESQPLLDS